MGPPVKAQRPKKLQDKYLLGEELGKGAHGKVFKGLDQETGMFVAVKEISLEKIVQADLASITNEIELLKGLSHKNIVKYRGSIQSKTHLYIILEFVENGSLANIIKPNKFGAFHEGLVAVYIAQVLEGLAYLHDQGIIHCDIKGANILTTKDGVVKLADFGVAMRISAASEEAPKEEGADEHVVGTPYWMAPEVIEMEGVSPASDIWSVGCTVVELLTTKPPYFDLQPMPALFRIVQDETPPMPEDVSPVVQDFLRLCFRKDPKLRPDARSLLRHPWIHQACQAKQQKQSVTAPQESVTNTSTKDEDDRSSVSESGDSAPGSKDKGSKEGADKDTEGSDSDYEKKLRQKIHLHGDTMKTLRAAARAARRQSPFMRHSVGGDPGDQLIADQGAGSSDAKQAGHQSTGSDILPTTKQPSDEAIKVELTKQGATLDDGGDEKLSKGRLLTPNDRTSSGTDSGGEGRGRRSIASRGDRGSGVTGAAASPEMMDAVSRREASEDSSSDTGGPKVSGKPPAPGGKDRDDKKGGGRTRLVEGEVIQVGDELLVVGAGGRLKLRRKKEKKEKGEGERNSDSGPSSQNFEVTPLASPSGGGGGGIGQDGRRWLQFKEGEEEGDISRIFSGASAGASGDGTASRKSSRGSRDWGEQSQGSIPVGTASTAAAGKKFSLDRLSDAQREKVEVAVSLLGVIAAAVKPGEAPSEGGDDGEEERDNVHKATQNLIGVMQEVPEVKSALLHSQGVLSLTDALQYGSTFTKEAAYKVLRGMLTGKGSAEVRKALLLSGIMPLLLHHLKPVPDNSPAAPIRLCSAQLLHHMLTPSLTDEMGAADPWEEASVKEATRSLVACRGLSTLAACLEGEYSTHRDMVRLALGCLWVLHRSPLPSPGSTKDICEQLARAGAYPRLVLTITSVARVCAMSTGRMGVGPMSPSSRSSSTENAGAVHRRLAAASKRSLGISSPSRTRTHLQVPPVAESHYSKGTGMRERTGSRGSRDGDLCEPTSPLGSGEAAQDFECLEQGTDLLLWACRGASAKTSSQHFQQLPLLKKVMELLGILPSRPLLSVLSLLRHLAKDPEFMEPLQRADGLLHLIPLLTYSQPPPASFSAASTESDATAAAQAADIQAQALLLLFAYCRDSRRRQEIAIEAGLVPALLSLVAAQTPLLHLGLPLLCDLAHSSSKSRAALTAQGAPVLFLSLLSPPTVTKKQAPSKSSPAGGDDVPVAPTAALSYENSVLAHWLPQVLDSLVVCVTPSQQDEAGSAPGIRGMTRQRTPPFGGPGAGQTGASGEALLLKKQSLSTLLNSFVAWSPSQMPLVLESYLRLLMKFPRVNAALSVGGLASLVVARLDDTNLDSASRLSLLKILKVILEQHPPPKDLVLPPDLPLKLQRLMEERRQVPPMHMQRGGEGLGQQVLVKQMASALLKSLHFSTGP